MLYRGNHRDQSDVRVRLIAGGVALASVLAAGAVFGTVWVADREPSDSVFQLADESDETNDETTEDSGDETEEPDDSGSDTGDDGEEPVAEEAPGAPEGA